jgi:crotonobetainyl-CoA:carnitine CoA-transferase CaiB-like acyl-CoA transferase
MVAAPGAGVLFAGMGAEVIKVEAMRGEAMRHIGSGAFVVNTLNHTKRSIAVDLKSDGGLAVARRLAERADVVIQNLAPGAMRRLGLGPDDIFAVNPRSVYVSISGFPRGGPSERRAGYDIAAQAETGLMSITGEADGPPLMVGTAVVDMSTAHIAVEAAVAALFRRERTGVGADIEVSLLEVGLSLQAYHWGVYLQTGKEPTRTGNGVPYNAPAADLIDTRDGYIVLSAYVAEHWTKLCKVLGHEEWLTDERFLTSGTRVAHRPEMLAALSEAVREYTTAEVRELLGGAGLVVAAVRTYSQTRDDADVAASGIIQTTTGPGGYDTIGVPFRFADHARPALTPAPAAGADTAAVLDQLGYTADEAAALLADGAVAG